MAPDRIARLLVLATTAFFVTATLGACRAGAPAPVATPAPPDLTTPVAAVGSYARWISFAYRVLDSQVATHAFSVSHEVAVDSYVQMLKTEKLCAIEQSVTAADYAVSSFETSRATVVGSETWRYRYIDTRTGSYASEPLEASYDVTYTLVVERGKGWVVDDVLATPRGRVE